VTKRRYFSYHSLRQRIAKRKTAGRREDCGSIFEEPAGVKVGVQEAAHRVIEGKILLRAHMKYTPCRKNERG